MRCVEGDDSTITEAGAFAKGRWRCMVLLCGIEGMGRLWVCLQAARDTEREERKVRRRKMRYGGLRILELWWMPRICSKRMDHVAVLKKYINEHCFVAVVLEYDVCWVLYIHLNA
jgi:hypothetical protein